MMESPQEAADSAPRTFSQVLFMDIPKSYPPSTSITCSYNLTAAFQPNPRDWVGVFKVGWSTTKDYHTFVWVEPCLDVVGQQSVTRQAVFKDYYLPKDESEFYQFCYVDSTGQVRGASTPFCFRSTVETSMESSLDDDLLVITTQEQVDQSVREKAELQKELDQIMAENETLKNAQRQEQQEAANLKEQNEEKEKENHQLRKEVDELKEQNESLSSSLKQQQEETEELKEKVTSLMTKQMQQHEEAELRRQSQSLSEDIKKKQKEEKYDNAVRKINQMKAEREELKETVESQSSELTALNSKLGEQDRELLKMKDSVSLLQVDLQSSEKEKERLSVELQRLQSISHNVVDLQRENQELTQRLSHLQTMNSPDDSLRVEYQTLTGKLQDAQVKLAAKKEESSTAKIKAELLDRELQDTREQLKKTTSLYEEVQRISNKQELKLSAMNELMAEKESTIEEKDDQIQLERHEKEQLTRENKTLIRDIEGLRRLNTDLQAASSVNPQHIQPEPTAPAHSIPAPPEWEIPEQEQHQYETIGSIADPEEEQSLVCAHCQERFPGITPEELEQHEQSHRVCPFCTMICDNMEQAVFEDHVYGHEL